MIIIFLKIFATVFVFSIVSKLTAQFFLRFINPLGYLNPNVWSKTEKAIDLWDDISLGVIYLSGISLLITITIWFWRISI